MPPAPVTSPPVRPNGLACFRLTEIVWNEVKLSVRACAGGSTIPSATSLNLSFVGDTLRLALGAYEYGMVVLNEQVDGRPAEYSFNSTWFPGTSTVSTLSFG